MPPSAAIKLRRSRHNNPLNLLNLVNPLNPGHAVAPWTPNPLNLHAEGVSMNPFEPFLIIMYNKTIMNEVLFQRSSEAYAGRRRG